MGFLNHWNWSFCLDTFTSAFVSERINETDSIEENKKEITIQLVLTRLWSSSNMQNPFIGLLGTCKWRHREECVGNMMNQSRRVLQGFGPCRLIQSSHWDVRRISSLGEIHSSFRTVWHLKRTEEKELIEFEISKSWIKKRMVSENMEFGVYVWR